MLDGRTTIAEIKRIQAHTGKGTRELAALFGVSRVAIKKALRLSPEKVFHFDVSMAHVTLPAYTSEGKAERYQDRFASKIFRRQSFENPLPPRDDSFIEFSPGYFIKRL